jgi:hypothetical protein
MQPKVGNNNEKEQHGDLRVALYSIVYKKRIIQVVYLC